MKMTKKLLAFVVLVAVSGTAIGAAVIISNTLHGDVAVTGLALYWRPTGLASSFCDVSNIPAQEEQVDQTFNLVAGDRVCHAIRTHNNVGKEVSVEVVFYIAFADATIPTTDDFAIQLWTGTDFQTLTWDPTTGRGVIQSTSLPAGLEIIHQLRWQPKVTGSFDIEFQVEKPGGGIA